MEPGCAGRWVGLGLRRGLGCWGAARGSGRLTGCFAWLATVACLPAGCGIEPKEQGVGSKRLGCQGIGRYCVRGCLVGRWAGKASVCSKACSDPDAAPPQKKGCLCLCANMCVVLCVLCVPFAVLQVWVCLRTLVRCMTACTPTWLAQLWMESRWTARCGLLMPGAVGCCSTGAEDREQHSSTSGLSG